MARFEQPFARRAGDVAAVDDAIAAEQPLREADVDHADATADGAHRSFVVEQARDLIALEATGMYRGLYHVLMGRLSPLDGISPAELTVAQLIKRVCSPDQNPGGVAVREVILGTNATVEGDGTSLYLAEQLRIASAELVRTGAAPVSVTRLARGLPAGSQLEFANKAVSADAILCRQSMQ